jgi:alcohol dehydrogenase (NADP+)
VESQEGKNRRSNKGIDMNESNNNSRRHFLRQSAVLGAGAVLAGSSNLFAEKSSGYGKGPYPTEGMAGYSETGPLQLLKFQRRALGPKDVAIKVHYCGVCHSDIHTIHGGVIAEMSQVGSAASYG